MEKKFLDFNARLWMYFMIFGEFEFKIEVKEEFRSFV
jgi:hypothetical protein